MMASPIPANTEEEQFRFNVKIMPPRRPTNSLFRRLQQPKVEEPLHTIAVPARASETFADVWKHIRERYERNYPAEDVEKGWFHKLQDRFGADIDSHDGVGALGYNPRTPLEECQLVMLQNAIERDGLVPETSGLRPAGFSRPVLTAEQERQAKRRKVEEERYGASLEELDEDTPIESREESNRLRSPQSAEDDDDRGRKVDADGFAVPTLPGSHNRKRKRHSKNDDDVIPSSVEGENEEDILVPGTQPTVHDEESLPGSLQSDQVSSRARLRNSMPADAAAGASTINASATRAVTAAPGPSSRDSSRKSDDIGSLHKQKSDALQGASNLKSKVQPRSPPTPVSGKSQLLTQQPPESAQRPKATPVVASTAANRSAKDQSSRPQEPPQDVLDLDPIEDDDLLQGIAGTANDDFDDDDFGAIVQEQDNMPVGIEPPSTNMKAKPGKLPKPNKIVAFTPKSSALELLSGSQGSHSKNPRTSSGGKLFWSAEEDAYLLQGLRQKLTAAAILKKFDINDRSTSAVRGRLKLLLKQHPELSSQKGVDENPSDDDRNAPSSSRKRVVWPLDDVQKISRAIAKGFDALEIQASYFPNRSEDAVNRKVLAVQDQVWKNASKDPFFPQNHAKLDGWTLKDGCKLRRTFQEGLTTQEAKNRFFGRWKMNQVQKQLDAYKAQIKALEADQSRGAQSARATDELAIESSQLPANSSPVERSLQARAARRPSIEVSQARPIAVPSSPPQENAGHKDSQAEVHSSAPVKRHSSPIVEISTAEQDRARTSLSRPSSGGSGKQTLLKFTREKGKTRAGAPRPSDEELDAQYSRRPTTSSTTKSAAHPQAETSASNTGQDDVSAGDDGEEHTPADDLDMLDAEFDNKNDPISYSKLSSFTGGHQTQSGTRKPSTGISERSRSSPTNTSPASGERRKNESSQRSLLSPLMTRHDMAHSSSDRRRQSRVESGVDTRAAVQLSQELQRSLSREGKEDAEQESQAFQTQDPTTTRSQRAAAAAAKSAPTREPAFVADDHINTFDSPAFQTQDSSATRSQRAAKAIQVQAASFAKAAQTEPFSLQLSPQVIASGSKATPVTTPSTTSATGKLPSRGQSYASKIRDLQRPTHAAGTTAARRSAESEGSNSTDANRKASPSKTMLPPPTDAELWERTANAEGLGRNRQEYFEDLKISAFSVRAMARGDWNEVDRLKAEQRRLRRERKREKGDYTSSAQDAQHLDGPAQGGDAGQADEDVIRADDRTSSESELEEEPDEKIWSDADFEQPEEMDRERHFSEVDEDEEADNLATKPDEKETEAPQDIIHGGHAREVEGDEQTVDINHAAKDDHSKDDTRAAHEEEQDEEEELELPTVPMMTETNGDVHHALTDENLQELNNSGGEGSPVRHSKMTQATKKDIAPSLKSSKLQSDDRAAMPPPSTKTLKRKGRRKRKARRHSESASEHSSSVNHAMPSSDAPLPQIPSTPLQKETSGRQNKKLKLSESTPVNQTPKSSRKTQTQPNTISSQAAPGSLIGGSQQSATGGGGGSMGLSGLVRKAHIPTPPKAKPVPQKNTKSKKFTLHAEDDESENSGSDSD